MSSLATEHLGVAVVDDDPVFRSLLCAMVQKRSNFVLYEAGSGDELFQVLANQRVDCVLLDYELGSDTGLAVKQRMDEMGAAHPPTIMLTGNGRESTAIRAFRMGVEDYIPKTNLRPESVVASVIKAVERDRREALVKAEHQRLVAAAAIDIVTGLEGRPRLEERLIHLAALPASARSAYALVAVELRDYSMLSERFGFKTADLALRVFGQRLQELTRSSDVCGRYAEGLFVIIADLRDGASPERICTRLSEGLVQRFVSDAADLTLSAIVVGVRCPTATPPSDGAALLQPAMAALAHAKAVGGDLPPMPTPPPNEVSTPAPIQTADVAVIPTSVRPAAEELRQTDRRRSPRSRVLKRGLMHIIGSTGTINCIVRNISRQGAGLRIDAPFAVPALFDLEIVGSGARQRVRVRWQSTVDVGVEYVESGDHG